MTSKYFYFSLQYSAIQKTVLRHDRLWSIAGASQILAWMNEMKMQSKATRNGGTVLVAGGGKFTAKFEREEDAKTTKKEVIKLVSTTLPMIEFQASEIIFANTMEDAKREIIDAKSGDIVYPGIINELDEQKNWFRGYGITFNPQMSVCWECGDYPAVEGKMIEKENVCAFCLQAHERARIGLKEIKYSSETQEKRLTTLEKIYKRYLKGIPAEKVPLIPLNFEHLFPKETAKEKGRRMAVWFSDLNNMKDKVPLWLSQDEGRIPDIFKNVKEVNVDIVSNALIETFKEIEDKYLPFRLIVAGGDDLRIVMAENYILEFALNLSDALTSKMKEVEQVKDHPLNTGWLNEELKKREKSHPEPGEEKIIKPYSFGGSFVVTSVHTPFRRIHEICEDLMGKAKRDTDREGNSVNWKVMAVEEDPSTKHLINFEKPLLIDFPQKGRLAFKKHVEMRNFYSEMLTGSHLQQIASKIIEYRNDSRRVEDWLKRFASAEIDKSFKYILVDGNFRSNGKPDGDFCCSRLATMLELLSIKSIKDKK